MCMLSRSAVSDSLQPRGLQPARLLWPCDSPGKKTGVGRHSPLQRILPTQGSNLGLLHWQADSLQSEPPGKPIANWYSFWNTPCGFCSLPWALAGTHSEWYYQSLDKRPRIHEAIATQHLEIKSWLFGKRKSERETVAGWAASSDCLTSWVPDTFVSANRGSTLRGHLSKVPTETANPFLRAGCSCSCFSASLLPCCFSMEVKQIVSALSSLCN